eukprot:scaffold2314_cov139-Skeletonema_menzelii.AAC.2
MFKWSSNSHIRDYNGSSSVEGNSILKNAKGRKKNFLMKKKKKRVDRSVRWSETFQTYEERRPQSFDAYEDKSCSRDGTFEYDDESVNSDYSDAEHSEYSNAMKTPVKISSVFTPIELPAKFSVTHSDDDASLIEDMDDYYDGSISKAASDDTSVVSYERMDEFRRQRGVDGNHGHLGLVMPSLDGFLTVFGVNKEFDDDNVSITSSRSSDKIAAIREANKRRNKAAGITKSTKEAQKDTSSDLKDKKSKDTRSVPTSPIETKVEKKSVRNTQPEKKGKKMKAKSTAELNVAIQQLETNSTESTESGIEVRHSSSDDVIEPLISDEVSESGIKLNGETEEKKKKYSIAGLKKNRNEPEEDQTHYLAQLWAQQQIKKDSAQTDLAKLWAQQQQQQIKEGSDQADLAELWAQQENLKAETSVAAAVELKQSSSSASTDGGSDSSGRKGNENNAQLKSLKNKLSFRRKKSTLLSGRELEFAYAQQKLQPLGDIYFLRKEFGDEVGSAGGQGQEALPIYSGNKSNKERARIAHVSRTMSEAPTMEKKETSSLKTKEELTAPTMSIKVKTEEQALADQPAVVKEPEQTDTVVDLQPRSIREQLYENILNADSFDSVSTTEDILHELEQIEEAAQKMYETYSVNGNGGEE